MIEKSASKVFYHRSTFIFNLRSDQHILGGGGEHQLDAVQLIDLAGTGIVVDRHDIGSGILFAQFLDHALAYYVVGQAAEGLAADNIGYTAVNQFHHFSG